MVMNEIKSILKNILKSYHLIISNSNSSKSFKILLKSMDASLNETLSILKFKFSKSLDKQQLYMIIKKNAHYVDKFLLFPNDKDKKKFKNSNYLRLKYSLKKWIKNNYEKTEPIKWALEILDYYEKFYPNSCPNCRLININHEIQNKINPENLLNLMKNRRSRRFYSEIPISEKEKDILVEAAIHAPSSCNGQAVRFLLIEDPSLKQFASQCIPGGKVFFNNAPTLIIILADKREYRHPNERYSSYQDTAAAIQNILLMAEAMDLACCWGSLTSYANIFNEKELRRKLNIPDFFLITGSIAIGHKTKEIPIVPRDQPKTKYSINKFYWDNK